MKMVKRFFLAVVIMMLFQPVVKPYQLSPAQIKGTYDIVDPKFDRFSAIHGAIWWKAGIIMNIYLYGPKDLAATKLVREIFHLQPDEVTFGITALPTMPAKYMDARMIGKLLLEVDQVVLDNISLAKEKGEFKERLTHIITEVLGLTKLEELRRAHASESKKLESQKKRQKKEIQSSVKKLEKKQKKGELTEQENTKLFNIKKQLNEIDKEHEKLKKEVLAKFETEIQDETKKLTTSGVIQVDINRIARLASLITDALEETVTNTSSLFNKYAVHNILLGFLWRSLKDKAELLVYYQDLDGKLSILKTGVLKSQDEQNEWVESQFTRDDFLKFKAAVKKNNSLAQTDFELGVFLVPGVRIFESPTPPDLAGGYSWIKGHKPFPDCGETALRNFFNFILYDPRKDIFDLSRLQQSKKISLHPAFVAYYQKHSDPLWIESREYYNDWAEVVSRIPGVDYRKKGVCNIAGTRGISNIMIIMEHLLFADNKKFADLSKEGKLDFLCESISESGTQLTWQVLSGSKKDVNAKDVDITLEFAIGAAEFQWKFTSQHLLVSSISKSVKVVDAVGEKLFDHVVQSSDNYRDLNLLSMFVTNKMLRSVADIPSQIYFQLVMALPMAHQDKRIKVLRNMLLNNWWRKNEFRPVVVGLLASFVDDPYYNIQIAEMLLKYKAAQEFYEEFNKRVANVEEDRKALLCRVILENKLHETNREIFDNFIKSIVSSGSSAILANALVDTGYEKVNRSLVRTTFKKVTDPGDIMDVVVNIVRKKRLESIYALVLANLVPNTSVENLEPLCRTLVEEGHVHGFSPEKIRLIERLIPGLESSGNIYIIAQMLTEKGYGDRVRPLFLNIAQKFGPESKQAESVRSFFSGEH